MASVNKVILVGNLGKDPEARFFPSGQKYVSFSLATSDHWKDKTTGEPKDRTEWHNITIHNDTLVGVAETYLKKGSKVYIEGQLQTRKWVDGKTGANHYATDVVLPRFKGNLTLLDFKNDSGDDQNQPQSFNSNYGQPNTSSSYVHSPGNLNDDNRGNAYGLEDEIPF